MSARLRADYLRVILSRGTPAAQHAAAAHRWKEFAGAAKLAHFAAGTQHGGRVSRRWGRVAAEALSFPAGDGSQIDRAKERVRCARLN